VTEFLVGGYTADMGGEAQGIGLARSHPDGRFEFLGVAAEVESPSWLVLDGGLVHAALEGAGEVASFARTDDGLALIGRVPAGGDSPCHLAVATDALLAACYEDGALGVIGLDEHRVVSQLRQVLAGEGSGPLPRQLGPHAHTVHPLADGRVLSVDLGADRLHVHRWIDGLLDRIDSVALPAGTGPRDLIELPGGELGLLGELSCELLLLEPVGDAYEVVQILALPGATPGADLASALGLSPDGRHLYAGVRGVNRIAIIELEADGAIAVGWVDSGGDWPRHLVVDGAPLSGGVVHVANQRSSTVATFQIGVGGALTPLGTPVAVPSPTHLLPLS
jgi:6-phosphogluconolactonase (cycloisomerase 2 family)